MTRTRLYWTCQLAGWGALFVTNLALNLVGRPFDWPIVATLATIAVGCVAGTHTFRLAARSARWDRLRPGQLVPLALASALAIGAVVGPAAVAAGFVLDPEHARAYRESVAEAIASGEVGPAYGVTVYVVNAVNVAVYVAAWMLVYFGVHVSRRAAEAEADRLEAERAVLTAERDRLQADVALSTARMRALEYQLNPHFLFNALNTVRALVHTDTAGADRAVMKLAGLLRQTLAAGREVTQPLGAELDLVRTYLDLERVRFGDRLAVRVNAEPDVLGVEVPSLLVQTLVENAVKHGVARRPGGGEVAVRAFRCAHPAGAGGPPAGLCVRVESPAAPDAPGRALGTGTGLANARERLGLLYGATAELTLGREGGLVVAEVRIPPSPRGLLSAESDRPEPANSAGLPSTATVPSTACHA